MRIRRTPRFRAVFVAFIAFAFSLAATLSGCDLPPIYEYWDSIVLNELEISPSFIALQEGQKATFSVIGGKVPYSFELSGDGSYTLAGNKVEYEAPDPALSPEARLSVRDIYDASSMARVMVGAISQLTIVPGSASLHPSDPIPITFTFSGGITPYSFRLIEGEGTVNEAFRNYTAPTTETIAVVRLEDRSGQYVDATIYVQAGVLPLLINPVSVELVEGATITFSAMGGVPPYAFTVSGLGSINSGTGFYTAATHGIDTVTVTDASSVTANATVTVVPATGTPLSIIPRSIDIKMGTSFQFSAEGGVPFAVPPYYIFEMVSSYGGTIDANGVYTAPTTRQGVEQLRVIDSQGRSDTATVKVKKK
jgi:hypothetical protein